MSTRWYPLYQRGNPQLRVFLPNFWIKLVQPDHKQPNNIAQFIVSIEMTKYDVKNYLEKVYDIPVIDVRTRIVAGKTKRDRVKGYVTKEDDHKAAYVTLANQEFVFPDLFPKDEKAEEEEKSIEQAKSGYRQYIERNKHRPGTPGWFSI